jgi:homoserine O-acetyltransferase/O-succinyltransferase
MGTLADPVCRIEASGPIDSPVVAVLGGISSSRHVTATETDPSRGWWNDFVGPARPIDALQFRVVGVDYIDWSCRDEPLATQDQAAAIAAALYDEGITRLHAVVGASYGGMVALALAELAPSFVERLVVICAAHQSSPSATAQRTLQRKVVELGSRAGLENEAVAIARGMAVTTYSTAQQIASRFDAIDPAEREKEIDRFLTLAGVSFAARCNPGRFVALSRSLDLHNVLPESIRCPTTLIGVIEDALVPAWQLRELAARIEGPCNLELVSSVHGHDAFLDDQQLIAPIVTRALSSQPGPLI